MGIRRFLSLGLILVLGVLLLAACGPSGASSGSSGGSAQQVTVTGNEFKFDPAQLTFKANQPVTVTFKNTGSVDHELDLTALPAKDVTVDLSQAGNIPADAKNTAQQDAQSGKVLAYAAPNSQASVTFTPTQAGTYSFACNLPGHKDAGMVGKATVQ
jgi:uncharacterized cupredoxin-like copper-binding protein